jgi:DNA-3-methyladenine glycosylase II
MHATLVATGPFSAARTLERHRLWGEDPVNHLRDGVFRRAIHVEGRWHGYRVTWTDEPGPARLDVSLSGRGRTRVMAAALAEVRHICGLDLDVASFYGVAVNDPVLGPLVRQFHGLRPTLSPRPFEMLVGLVCAQQINLTVAFTMRTRLARRFGTPVAFGGETIVAFPEAAALAEASVAELRRLQFTTRKAECIVGLAQRIVTGQLDVDALGTRTNDEIVEALIAVRGFGRWTAEWFLARGLGRGDVCPAGDLGVRRAFEHFYNRGRALSEDAIRRRAAAWGPHQNLAVHYLLAGQRHASSSRSGGGA